MSGRQMAASYSSGALEDSEGDLSANPVIASSPVASQGPSLPLDNAPDVETVAEVSSDRPEDNVDTLTAEQKKGEDTQEEEEQIGAPNDDASRTDKVQQDNEDVLGGDDDDDDFGDFDTAGEAPLHTEAPLPPPTNTGLLPVNAAEEARIADLLSSRRFLVDSVILQAYGPLLTQAFPLVAPLPLNTTASILETSSPSRSAHSKDEEGASSRNGLIWAVQVPSKTLSHKGTTEPGSNTLYTPNPELCSSQSSTWVELYQRLSQDTVFSESGSRFRWRRSAIRRAFLQSLNLDVAAVEVRCLAQSLGVSLTHPHKLGLLKVPSRSRPNTPLSSSKGFFWVSFFCDSSIAQAGRSRKGLVGCQETM